MVNKKMTTYTNEESDNEWSSIAEICDVMGDLQRQN